MSPLPRLDRNALAEAFFLLTDGAEVLSRRTVIILADAFDLDPLGMVRVLETMGLARAGSVNWFRENGGISEESIAAVRREMANAHVQSRRGAAPCRPL